MAALGVATERAIFAQADELKRLWEAEIADHALHLGDCRRIWLVGTGTSQHAARLGAAMLREAGFDALPAPAMDFVHFSPKPRREDGVVLITHTAETAYALSARSKAIEAGATLVSITKQGGGWPEAVENVPKESSETYTLSYTATLLVLAKIAAILGAQAKFRHGIGRVASAVRAALERPGMENIPLPRRAFVLAGVGPAAVTAYEGALKIREASRLIAEGYDAEYLLHGSTVPLGKDDGLLLLHTPGDPDGFLIAVGRVAAAEGIAVSIVEDPTDLHPLLAQIPLTVRLQLLALRFSRERDQDADVAITGAWAEDDIWALGSHE